MTTVAASDWVDSVRRARADGWRFFDWMDCVDEIGRSEELRVLISLIDLDSGAARTLETLVPRENPRLDSLTDELGGAAWAERELSDLFGLEFVGGDPEPLLIPARFGAAPLLKDEILGARAAAAWPGAREPGESSTAAPSRRRMVPPGVPDPEVWGDRDPQTEAPDAAQIAASAQGGRVRRQRGQRGGR